MWFWKFTKIDNSITSGLRPQEAQTTCFRDTLQYQIQPPSKKIVLDMSPTFIQICMACRFIHYPYSLGIGNVYETVDSNQFENTIAELSLQSSSASGTVPTVEAVLAAGRASEADSSIFVFTNSPPSDENLLGQAEAITAQRNLKVFFVDDVIPVTKRSIGDSGQLRYNLRHKRIMSISSVYSELEIFSSGGVVSVPTTEISDLATLYLIFCYRK